jgi:hypothetical protein
MVELEALMAQLQSAGFPDAAGQVWGTAFHDCCVNINF